MFEDKLRERRMGGCDQIGVRTGQLGTAWAGGQGQGCVRLCAWGRCAGAQQACSAAWHARVSELGCRRLWEEPPPTHRRFSHTLEVVPSITTMCGPWTTRRHRRCAGWRRERACCLCAHCPPPHPTRGGAAAHNGSVYGVHSTRPHLVGSNAPVLSCGDRAPRQRGGPAAGWMKMSPTYEILIEHAHARAHQVCEHDAGRMRARHRCCCCEPDAGGLPGEAWQGAAKARGGQGGGGRRACWTTPSPAPGEADSSAHLVGRGGLADN